jgi:hypothetical protein
MSTIAGPYRDQSANFVYQLLFCDNAELFKLNTQKPYQYPFDILFSEDPSVNELQQIVNDDSADARVRVLAYNHLRIRGIKPASQELLAVIVEVGLDSGLDVVASFQDGTARYINQTGKILVWETTSDAKANELTAALFASSEVVITKIGPWDQARRPHPRTGNVRITFLVSDGLYFGEGPIDVLFGDPLAGPTLNAATQLMIYITEKSLGATGQAEAAGLVMN